MPARPSVKFRCFCIICIADCETGPDNTPLGKLIPESQRISHLARAKAEANIQSQLQESELQNSAASLFANTLVADGSDMHAQPSRFWSSREDYQSSVPNIPPESNPLPINTIIESFQRLQPEVQGFTPLQSVSQSPFPSETEALPYYAVKSDDQYSTFVQSMRPAPDIGMMEANTAIPSAQSLSKRERSNLTKTAHSILDWVERQISHWSLLLANIASGDALAGAEADISHIQTVFDKVRRSVNSVNVRKVRIAPNLLQLQGRLVELRRKYPYADDKPLQFDSGMYFTYKNEYRTEAQVKVTIIICPLISVPLLHN
jgi:hypothetical protein